MVMLRKRAVTFLSAATIFALSSTLLEFYTRLADDLSSKITTVTYPPDRKKEVLASENPSFDFVIVGCGSAGSVLASRLSENKNWSVLVIEVGHDPLFFSEIPAFAFDMQSTSQNFAYMPEVQSEVCLSMKNKVCEVDKGRAVGGTSVINAMLYVPGNKQDYDSWAADGNEGWCYEDVLPYFKKSQQMQPDYIAKYGTENFGAHGLLPLRRANSTFSPLQDIVLEGTAELGFRRLKAMSLHDQCGFGRNHQTMDNGRRMNVAKAFLAGAPVRDRKNLYLMKNTRADKILIEDRVAKGVLVTFTDGSTQKIMANKEVIMSAGSIATPQVLMLSGIGPREHLEEMGIEVVVDLAVGKHLQDHLAWVGSYFTYKNDSRPSGLVQMISGLKDYLRSQTGLLAALPGIDLLGFFNVHDPTDCYPNIEILALMLPQNNKIFARSACKGAGLGEELTELVLKEIESNDIYFPVTVLLHPKSVGEIILRSTDPKDPPRIFNKYLTVEEDVDTFLKVVQFYKSLAATDAFVRNGMSLKQLLPMDCEVHENDSRDFWECSLRHVANTLWHHSGTAKMGPANDSTAVVDPQLRVYGIDRLRVVDASIFPSITSGHNNAPTIMIAEKAADMLKATWA